MHKGVKVGYQNVDTPVVKTHETNLSLYDAFGLLDPSEENGIVQSALPSIKRPYRRISRARGNIDITTNRWWLDLMSGALADGIIIDQDRLDIIQQGKPV